jgi:hypothetical protein
LLKTVKDGINFLDKKYLKRYERTENSKICRVRDIPENPGKLSGPNRSELNFKSMRKEYSRFCWTTGENILKGNRSSKDRRSIARD